MQIHFRNLLTACCFLAVCINSLKIKAASVEKFKNSIEPQLSSNYRKNTWNRLTSALKSNPITSESGTIKPSEIKTQIEVSREPHELSKQQFVYFFMSSVFITCLIVADIIGVKLFNVPLPFNIFGFTEVEHSCGMLTFPITFLLGDMINEYYGPKAARRTVYVGFVMSALVFLVLNVAQALPYLDKSFNVTKDSFDTIFGSAKLMFVASITAYLVGNLSDIWLFGVIKRVTKGKFLWLRATGSTIISQFLDSFVVSYVAFSLGKTLTGQVPASIPEVANIAVTGYGLKLFLSLAITPLLYILKKILTEQFQLEPIPA